MGESVAYTLHTLETLPTILIVDDDVAIRELLRDFCVASGFQVALAETGSAALAVLDARAVDAIVLDIMMPGMSGFDLARQIRQTTDVPILFLSARDSDADKLRGLGLGGDDYIVKTATPSEVVARIKAVLRRARRSPTTTPPLDFGRFTLDPRAREVLVAGAPVTLTAREYDLLMLLVTHAHQVLTHDQIFERIWGDIGDRHTVAVHINRLRQKLERDPAEPELFLTVWGVGYRFEGRRRP